VTRGQTVLIGGLVVGVLVIWFAVARLLLPAVTGADAVASDRAPSSGPSNAVIGDVASASPTGTATAEPPTPAPTATAEPTATDTPKPAPTGSPRGSDATDDPRLRYAEFLVRLDDARTEVAPLNAAISDAAKTGDKDTVRATAVDILQFADRERDWLVGHPPADCYTAAHDAAGAMLEAYATVADRAIDWTGAKAGLGALQALARVAEAADDAQTALRDLGRALESTTCLA
jgi:hypothetical protein